MLNSCKTAAVWLAIACVSLHANGQVGIGITNPDPNSILHIQSTDKGLLIPRLSSGKMDTLSGILPSSAKGMLVTDAATGKLKTWNGTIWTDPTNLTATSPLTVSATNQIGINPGTQAGDLITWDGNNWISTQPAVQHFSYNVENHQPYLTLNYCIAVQGVFPSRADASLPFVSEIDLFPFNFPPKGWAQCDGQLMAIAQNTALFSLLGTFYGGNGTSTFAIPDMRGRVPVHQGQGPGLSNLNIGDSGGVETNTITR